MDFLRDLFGKKQSDSVMAQDYFEKGAEHAKQQNWQKAIEALKEAVRLNPKHAKAHMALCMAYGGVMDLDSARHHYEILKQLDPDLANRLANTTAGMLILGVGPMIMMGEKPTITPTQDAIALVAAVEESNTDLVNTLINKGADVNTRNEYGSTVLTIAVAVSSSDIVRILLDRGADVNARGSHDITALINAAFYGRTDIVQALLEKGADVNAKDELGETALMRAAMKGCTDIVRLLLEKSVDVNAKDNEGKTTLSHAAAKGHTSIVQLLKEAGVEL